MPAYREEEKRDAATEVGIAEDKVFVKTKDDAGFSSTLHMTPESAREMGRYLIGLADLVDPPEKKPNYVEEFENLWGSAKGCVGPLEDDYATYVGDDHPLWNVGRKPVRYYTDDAGEDHMIAESYEFSYYYDKGERVLYNGDLYDIYALCEPSYILRDPTGSVMTSVKVTESDLEKIDVKKQR